MLEEFDADRSPSAPTPRSSAYPHGPPRRRCSELRERGLKVVDLSADFRLDRERYERYYQPHEAPELLGEAGLRAAPSCTATRSRGADLVAAPGLLLRPPRSSRCGRCAT